MIRWRATGKIVKANVEKTVFYRGDGTDYRIESRTRWIQNNKNNGRRLFTTYVVLLADEVVTEKMSLTDAKEYVEKLMKGDRDGTD